MSRINEGLDWLRSSTTDTRLSSFITSHRDDDRNVGHENLEELDSSAACALVSEYHHCLICVS